jgi:hypothetical protein
MIRHYAPAVIVLVALSVAIGVLQGLYQWGPWTLAGVMAVEVFFVMGLVARIEERRGPYRRA